MFFIKSRVNVNPYFIPSSIRRPPVLYRDFQSRRDNDRVYVSATSSNRNVLVLNAGSSSLKFKVFQLGHDSLNPSMGGMIERIGEEAGSALVVKAQNKSGQAQKWDIKTPVRSE